MLVLELIVVVEDGVVVLLVLVLELVDVLLLVVLLVLLLLLHAAKLSAKTGASNKTNNFCSCSFALEPQVSSFFSF